MTVRPVPRHPRPRRWLPAATALVFLLAVLPVPAPAAVPGAWVEMEAELRAGPGPAEILGFGLVALGPRWSLCVAGISGASEPVAGATALAGPPEAVTVLGNQGWHALEMEWNVSGNPDPPPEGLDPE